MARKPLLCRLGVHELFNDGGLFSSVQRCRQCPYVASEEDARKVALERELWKKYGYQNLRNAEVMGIISTSVLLGREVAP